MLRPRNWPRRYRSYPIPAHQRAELMRRHDGVPGFEAGDYPHAHVAIVGANGTGYAIAAGLVQKGVRQLTVVDYDLVELTNCNRTGYRPRHVGKNKAYVLGRLLARRALMPLTVHSYALYWQEYVEQVSRIPRFDALVCAVDNNPSRRAMTAYGHEHRIPIIHCAIGRDANSAYVFCQVPGSACWACAFPQYLDDETYPCGVPAIVDVLNVASGFVLAVADSLISARPRHFNLRQIYMSGGLPDRTQLIKRRPDCPICASASH